MNKLKTLFDVQTVTEVPAQQLPEPPKLKVGNTPIEIALQIDEQGGTTARKLYGFLELNQTHYSRWRRKCITENDFAEENIDFIVLAIEGEKPKGGRPTQDYILTATFAKKLAMTFNSVKGEQAREYFIKVEEQLKKAVIAMQKQQTQPVQSQYIQQINRISLDDVTLLTKLQAATRYNIGCGTIKKISDDIGATVFIGKKILFHRQTLDEYFNSIRQ